MAENITMNVGEVLTTIIVKDSGGITVGAMRVNLFDVRLVSRLQEIAEFLRGFRPAGNGIERMMAMDVALEDKFCYLLGYDCRAELFGVLSPTSILPDGEMYTIRILQTIEENFADKIKERAEARAAVLDKYLQRYKK